MNANAARLRKVLPLTAAIALLLSAAAACLSLGFVSAHELSPQPALASADRLAPQPAAERLPHPQLVPPERPVLQAAPEPEPGPAQELSPQQTPASTQEPAPQPGLPPHFPAVTSRYEFDKDRDIGTETLPAAAGGAGGFTYSLSPALPEGLSFNPATRALTGTPAEFGDHAMTYTATDANGAEISASFNIVIRGIAAQNLLPTPKNLAVKRKRVGENDDLAHYPAFLVTWEAPSTDLSIESYGLRYTGGTGSGGWIHHTIDKDKRSVTLTSLEPGGEYRVDLQVNYSDGTSSRYSTAKGYVANRPPALTSTFIGDDVAPWRTVACASSAVLASNFSDPENDSLTYLASSNYPGIVRAGVDSEDDGCRLWARAINPGTATITYGAHDGYGGYVYRTFGTTVIANVTRSVVENSPAGTAVGGPVTGTPYDDGDPETDDTLTYTLSNGDSGDVEGVFVIDSSTGQITVAEGVELDYEHKSSYTGKVNWTIQGQAVAADLTIEIGDVSAGQPAAPTVTRTPSDVEMNPALDVAWTAPDPNGFTIIFYHVQYRKKGATEWTDHWHTFTDPVTGHLLSGNFPATITSITMPDLEAGVTYQVRVRALTEEEYGSPWSDPGEATANTPAGSCESSASSDYFDPGGAEWASTIGEPWPSWNIGHFHSGSQTATRCDSRPLVAVSRNNQRHRVIPNSG